MNRKSLVIASGDPAGCGPIITLSAIQNYRGPKADFFVVGDKKIFKKNSIYNKVTKKINFIDLNTPGAEKVKPGYSSRLSGALSLSYLETALKILKNQRVKHLVTAPLSKEAVKMIRPKFCGQTEYLAKYFKVKNPVMIMVSKKLKVVLLSRHISLREVSGSLKEKNIIDSLSLVYQSLKKQFKIRNPKITFSSLNPHAGVDTFLEKEERVIAKAIKKFKKPIQGPYPADSLFIAENIKKYDCLICSYHDQAMIPFKLLSLKEGVNLTLGLPIIRTSPAHGTAYDLMRTSRRPFHSSMLEAIKLALKLSP